MNFSDLTSCAQWRACRLWDRGARILLARKSGRGFALRTWWRPNHLAHLLAEGWEVVGPPAYKEAP